jgi:Fe-S-cluster formation regulator IscX/YfhJ
MSDEYDDFEYDFGESRWATEREILFRLDERTERIDERMGRIQDRLENHQEQLDEHDDRIQKNTTILSAITFGITSALTAILAKVQGFIKW